MDGAGVARCREVADVHCGGCAGADDRRAAGSTQCGIKQRQQGSSRDLDRRNIVLRINVTGGNDGITYPEARLTLARQGDIFQCEVGDLLGGPNAEPKTGHRHVFDQRRPIVPPG